jgi:hypothetical protein
MPPALESTEASLRSRLRTIVALALCAFGFAFTLYVFYPGVMTIDARYVYNDMSRGFYGDWQSPAMALLWRLIDPILPHSRGMLLANVVLYWLAFALIATTLARRSWLAVLPPLLALTPPAFVLVGDIWRDVLLAGAWLLAAALVFFFHERSATARHTAKAVALGLLLFGVLLRPNAIPAAPILAAYIVWPASWYFKRALLLYVPAFVALAVIVPAIYYGAVGAKRQHPEHGLLVFDLGGITHFTKQNQFPVTWTDAENALLVDRCYQPDKWDHYWYLEPCLFVMKRLEGDKIFGTPELVTAWRRAVFSHPLAYLQHRLTFTWNFLTGLNLVMWTQDIENPDGVLFADKPAFRTLIAIHEILRPTWLFKPIAWLLLCIALCMAAWRRRDTAAGAFVLGTCGSAIVFVMTYFLVGVASDYRYAYWATLAGLTGIAALLPRANAPINDTA